MENNMEIFLKKLKIKLTNPAIPFLAIYPKEKTLIQKLYIIAVLFKIARIWKQGKAHQ